ncbi:MAG: disulfide bond formation protein B [Alphaproteobacteria bacterium]|nr:disulfide bond formation protein B [Alphaproteobacteria bacterium]
MTPGVAAAIIFIASVLALGGALVSQYGFGLRPCHLCLWQRVPYAVTLLLAVVAWTLRANTSRAGLVAWLCTIVFVAGGILASYHAAVEWRLIAGPDGCTGEITPGMSLEDLQARINGAAAVRCDEPALVVLGLSMAGWNAVLSFGLAAAVWWMGKALRRKS